MKVRLLVAYGDSKYGDIVELNEKELKQIGAGNFEEAVDAVVSSDDTNCTELQDKYDGLVQDITDAKKLDDLKAIQEKLKA